MQEPGPGSNKGECPGPEFVDWRCAPRARDEAPALRLKEPGARGFSPGAGRRSQSECKAPADKRLPTQRYVYRSLDRPVNAICQEARSTGDSNCSSSVEPVKAVVDDWPPETARLTASK